MLETKEQDTSPVEENHQPPEEINKYNKRIDNLIEDAEIEAEIEAEKNIRSKNSRMFSISMIGIGLLGLVYFQINHKTALPQAEPEVSIQKPETAEERLAKQVPVVEDGSIASNLPVSSPTITKKVVGNTNPFVKPSKPKKTNSSVGTTAAKKPAKVAKVSITPKPKSIPEKTIPQNIGSRFFIQAGAFGVKANAELFMKQLKGKGFAPSIQTRSQKTNQYVVTVGIFANTKTGNGKLKELANKGFKASYFKTSKNSYGLKVGQFKNSKDAQGLQDRLSLKGFLSESHKADVPDKTYIVQLGVFPNREKAVLTQEKLARAGYPKTFLR
jgi:cell division protein FtsN